MTRAGKKELCGDPEFDKLAKEWNENLRDCMNGMSQETFAQLLNERFDYRTTYTQPVINDWLHVGRDQMFPRYEVMVKMADILGVSVSRLIGETTFDSIPAQTTSEYTGLSNDAIRSLRKITRGFDSSFSDRYVRNDVIDEHAVQLVNSILTSESFLPMLVAMSRLAERVKRPRNVEDAVIRQFEKEHGEATFKKAIALLTCRDLPPIEGDETIDSYWVSNESALSRENIQKDELPSLFIISEKMDAAIHDARVKEQEAEMWDLACRYQARVAFDRLLDELFPLDQAMQHEDYEWKEVHSLSDRKDKLSSHPDRNRSIKSNG